MLDVNVYAYVFVLGLTVVILSAFGYNYYKKKFKKGTQVVRRPAPARGNAVVGGVRRRVAPAAVQRQQNRNQARMQAEAEELEPGSSGASDAEENKEATTAKKIGVKKSRKLAEKKERKEQREAEEREREERKKLEAAKDKERLLKEMEEQKEEELREEEARLSREAEEQREFEEYSQMKLEFSVEDEGQEGVMDEEKANQSLREFLEHVRFAKVVMVEELASKFDLKVQDCVDRLKALQESGDLTGVLDDRGKFVYITAQEYEEVAKFIRQRGRVTIKELAENSNKLIQLSNAG